MNWRAVITVQCVALVALSANGRDVPPDVTVEMLIQMDDRIGEIKNMWDVLDAWVAAHVPEQYEDEPDPVGALTTMLESDPVWTVGRGDVLGLERELVDALATFSFERCVVEIVDYQWARLSHLTSRLSEVELSRDSGVRPVLNSMISTNASVKKLKAVCRSKIRPDG